MLQNIPVREAGWGGGGGVNMWKFLKIGGVVAAAEVQRKNKISGWQATHTGEGMMKPGG